MHGELPAHVTVLADAVRLRDLGQREGLREVMCASAGRCRSASWPHNPLGRRRINGEQAGRADGAPHELTAAVRADAVQDVLRAVAAPGALVRADKHVRGCRVEVPVAAFAIRPQLQHMISIDRQLRLQQASDLIPTAEANELANVCSHRTTSWSEVS